MASLPPPPTPEMVHNAIITLGQDLFAMKLYWTAVSALWFYDYFLTLPEEVKFGWKGRKTLVFYLYIANRYMPFVFIVITLIAYFLKAWDLDTCSRYGFMETLETTLLTTTAEVFLMLRIYAISGGRRLVFWLGGFVLAWQWAIAIYAMSQSSKGTPQVAFLLPLPPPPPSPTPPPLPVLPDADPYHICIFISVLSVTPWVEAFLCLSLAFDSIVFLAIAILTMTRMRKQTQFTRILEVIQRDGLMYFFVLFSSNLIWVLLLLYARMSLKFIHNQPAMIISAIMINRITINLKSSSSDAAKGSRARLLAHTGPSTYDPSWSMATFQAVDTHPVSVHSRPPQGYGPGYGGPGSTGYEMNSMAHSI